MQITVWNEFFQERNQPNTAAVYPDGIHTAIGEGLLANDPSLNVGYAWLGQPDDGLAEEVLGNTDVLLWWGHLKHGLVSDDVVARVRRRVLGGMGLILLHSGIESKVASAVLGTTCKMSFWRHDDRELVWTVDPAHPIAQGVPNPLIIDSGEMYGEPLDVPTPSDLVFITSYEGGEVLRSGIGWHVGRGRVFFVSNGHEEHPLYYRDDLRRLLSNVVAWAAPTAPIMEPTGRVANPDRDWWRAATTEGN